MMKTFPLEESEYTLEVFKPQNSAGAGAGANAGAGPGAGVGPGPSSGPGGPAAQAAPAAYTPEPWPELDKTALYGLAGEVVDRLAPQTESDPAALLLTYLTSFGNAVGRGPYYEVEATQHFANLFALLVGDTAKARKGTSTRHIRSILQLADAEWARERIRGGMSSGEGVITAVRDPVFALRKGVLEMVDPGVTDKRLLLYEPEFSSVLAVLNREGSILSRIVRDAWDCQLVLETMTKHSPTRATEAFISIVGHITIAELQRRLDETSMANGFANRFLLGCVRRARLLPHGGNFQANERALLGQATLSALTTARTRSPQLLMTEEARERWTTEYPTLSKSGDKLTDHMTARGEAQVTRLALIYTLLDQSTAVEIGHLEAALALWRFCQASTRYVFGEMTGDTTGDVILRALRTAGSNGMARTDIINLFGRNLPAAKIDATLGRLQAAGKVVSRLAPLQAGAGRPRQMWYAV
jgi:hypothetical protein